MSLDRVPIADGALAERLGRNLRAVRRRLEEACRAAGRPPDGVRLVAVTKSVGPRVAAALARLGQADLAESRVGELERKAEHLTSLGLAVRWHLLGHLQTNKARRALRLADEIHSADSIRLLEALDRIAGEEGRRPRVYLEVDLVQGSARTGMAPADLPAAARRAVELPHLVPVGLMAMGPEPDRAAPDRAAAVFRRLAELRDALPAGVRAGFERGRAALSMGMSSDLEPAVAAGSDLVRIGSALFEGIDDPDVAPGGPA